MDWTLPWHEILHHWNERVKFFTNRHGLKSWSAVCLGQFWKFAHYVSHLRRERWVVRAMNWFQLGGTGSRPSCPPAPWTRPSTSNPRSRMATARCPVIPPQLPPRTPQPSRPRQPSLVGFPVWTARQPCVHHDPLWPRHNIPTAYLPNPALETPPSRLTSVSSPLSVPSHSRSLGRPPFSLCPGRGTSIPRSPTRKSSRQSLPRSRRPRDYQHTTHGLKHRQHPAAR